MTCSALRNEGVQEAWETMKRYREMLEEDDQLASRRASQARSWLWAEVNDYLLNALRSDPEVEQEIPRLEAAVRHGNGKTGLADRTAAAVPARIRQQNFRMGSPRRRSLSPGGSNRIGPWQQKRNNPEKIWK